MSDVYVNFPKPCDERWENMTPGERHRTCARCDRVVHDLSQYDVAGIEKLLRDEPGSCVRASIDVSGAIDTRPDSHGRVRLMVAAIGVSAGLLMSPPALARDQRAKGAIVGTAQTFSFFETTVTATDKNGNSYRAKAKSSGRYRIKNVPPGTYLVEFSSDCGERWSVEDVVVADRAVDVTGGPSDDQRCIVVGLLEIGGRRGESDIG